MDQPGPSNQNQCHICGEYFATQQLLFRHIGQHHAEAKFKCKKCQKLYDFEAMETHSHKRKNDEEPRFRFTEYNNQSAYGNRLMTSNFIYIGIKCHNLLFYSVHDYSAVLLGPADLLRCFQIMKKRIKAKLLWYLTQYGPLRFYFSLQTSFEKMDGSQKEENYPIIFRCVCVCVCVCMCNK